VLDMVKDPSLHDLARATSDITDVGRFDDGSDDWLAFRCELGDRPVTVFNFSQTPPLHSSSGPVPFRVAKIQVDGLPRFSLEPRSAATVVETVVGKLLHQPESTIELDPGQHASFGSRYRLRRADRTAVVEVFTPERRVLAEHVAAARPSRATQELFSPDASRRCSPPEAPDRTGASVESGRPGSNRRRPAWEAVSALWGKGFTAAPAKQDNAILRR